MSFWFHKNYRPPYADCAQRPAVKRGHHALRSIDDEQTVLFGNSVMAVIAAPAGIMHRHDGTGLGVMLPR